MILIPAKLDKAVYDVRRLPNYKYAKRTIIIYCGDYKNGNIVPLPQYEICLINHSGFSGRGSLMSNAEMIQLTYSYYGTINNPFTSTTEEVLSLHQKDLSSRIDVERGVLKFTDYNTSFRRTDLSGSDDLKKGISPVTETCYYDELVFGTRMWLGKKDNVLITLPEPKYYSSEHEIKDKNEYCSYDEFITNIAIGSGIDPSMSNVFSLADLIDEHTEILLANVSTLDPGDGWRSESYYYEDLPGYLFLIFSQFKDMTSRHMIDGMTLILDTEDGWNIPYGLESNHHHAPTTSKIYQQDRKIVLSSMMDSALRELRAFRNQMRIHFSMNNV